MAFNTISTSFVEEFEAGVHMAYQRMGSKLRNTTRSRDGVKNKTTFQKVGKGTATQKARAGSVPPMNLEHTNVNVTLEDWFAGEWVDDLDTLRVNHDEMVVAQESGAYALGRKTDDIIKAALDTTTTTSNETTNGVTLAWALGVMETMGNNDVPDDGQRYAVIGWENWSQLMSIDQFSRAEYVGMDQLPFPSGMTAKNWLGFMWFPHSGLDSATVSSVDCRKCFMYHKTAIGHAIGADVQSNIDYHNDKDSYFILNKMQMNAALIDVNGCIEANLKK